MCIAAESYCLTCPCAYEVNAKAACDAEKLSCDYLCWYTVRSAALIRQIFLASLTLAMYDCNLFFTEGHSQEPAQLGNSPIQFKRNSEITTEFGQICAIRTMMKARSKIAIEKPRTAKIGNIGCRSPSLYERESNSSRTTHVHTPTILLRSRGHARVQQGGTRGSCCCSCHRALRAVQHMH